MADLMKRYRQKATTELGDDGKPRRILHGHPLVGQHTFFHVARAVTQPTIAKAGVSYF